MPSLSTWELSRFPTSRLTGALLGQARSRSFQRSSEEIVFSRSSGFRLLHVSHDDIVVPVARINKVKALLDLLIPNFQASYNPSRDVSVDETMIGFRGRFSAKQYLLNKPTKYGVKAFTIADSSHGYILNILLYTGKDTLANTSPQYKDQQQPAQVVLHLAEPYLDQGRHVFTDRYYTSISLAKALSD